MIASLTLGALLWPAIITDHCKPQPETIIIGIAQDANDKFLYCEIINQSTKGQLHIDYSRSAKIFATKDLIFSDNPFTPDIIQVDSRSGERREANVDKQNLIMKYQETSSKKVEQTRIPLRELDILDAGFDNFVRAHWDELLKGKNVPVNFASIAHQKVLPLRINAKPLAKCTVKAADKSDQTKFCFWVDIDNIFLRLLFGNIKLNYDQQHRLIKFEGVVNVQDDNQDNQSATIHYFYKTDYLSSE